MSVENQTYLVKLWEELKNIEHKDAVKQVADLDDDDEIALEIKDAEVLLFTKSFFFIEDFLK